MSVLIGVVAGSPYGISVGGAAAPPPDPPTRANQYAEALAETSVVGTTYTSKVTRTLTPVSGKDYLIFWSGVMRHSTNSAQARARLRNTTDAVDLGFHLERPFQGSALDLMPFGGFARFTAPNTTQRTFEIAFSSSGAGPTTYIQQARIAIVEQVAGDFYFEVLGESTAVTTVEASNPVPDVAGTPASYTFNVTSAGWYALRTSCEINGNSTVVGVKVQLDGVDLSRLPQVEYRTGSSYPTVYFQRKVWLSAGSHTVRFIIFSRTGVDNVKGQRFRIWLHPVYDLSHVYAEQIARVPAAASNTPVTGVQSAHTPRNKPYLVTVQSFADAPINTTYRQRALLDGVLSGINIDRQSSAGAPLANLAMYPRFWIETPAAVARTMARQVDPLAGVDAGIQEATLLMQQLQP